MLQIKRPNSNWKHDEEVFKSHFNISYVDFCELVSRLTEEQTEKYEAIRETNDEAAILWAIHEGKSHGLLKEV